MFDAVHTSGFDWHGMLYLGVVLVVIFTPVFFRKRGPSPQTETDSDDDRGGGGRRPPRAPLGGPPLPNADQSRTRIRDHGRLANLAARRRSRSLHRPRRRSRTAVG